MATHSSILAWEIPQRRLTKDSDKTSQLNNNNKLLQFIKFKKIFKYLKYVCRIKFKPRKNNKLH